YRMSPRPLPASLPQPVYDASDQVRKVNAVGRLSFDGHGWQLGEAFAGEAVGLRRTGQPGRWSLYFGRYRVAMLDQERLAIEAVPKRDRLALPTLAPLASATPAGVTHVPGQVSPMSQD